MLVRRRLDGGFVNTRWRCSRERTHDKPGALSEVPMVAPIRPLLDCLSRQYDQSLGGLLLEPVVQLLKQGGAQVSRRLPRRWTTELSAMSEPTTSGLSRASEIARIRTNFDRGLAPSWNEAEVLFGYLDDLLEQIEATRQIRQILNRAGAA